MPRQGASSTTASTGRTGGCRGVGDDRMLPAAAGAREVLAEPPHPSRRRSAGDHGARGASQRDRLAARRGAGVVDDGPGGEVDEADDQRLGRVLDEEGAPA